ncbi:ABC transporter substrate-binding protein [Nonomuraea sp. NPDC050404]|uniref:ABC transporter substrate-binding protein n=1 Tax=Nonomuraea sp. NPDC050404 TaxID=3155783 RepID=UPI0033E4577D
MNRPLRTAAALAVAVASLTACGSGGGGSGQSGRAVSGGVFVKAISSDPGSLVPMTGVSLAAREMAAYAYESLVYATPDGKFEPWLATKWEVTGKKITYTLHDGITCSDGTPFTAGTAADNINYHAEPEHATFYYGSQINKGVTAEAEGNTLTITSESADPFLLANTGVVEMVCAAGLKNPDSLKAATNGTGLYALSKATAGSTYTYTRRQGYKWGPAGVTSETAGLPDTLEIRVISDESTAANLLVSGEIHAAVVTGADRQRLDAAGLKSEGTRNPVGEMLFNERAERPTSDPLVRQALVTALDRKAIGDVVSDGSAMEARSLVVKTPLLCVEGGPKWTLPATDPGKAAALLDQAGWRAGPGGKRVKDGKPLTVKFIYDAATATHASAAELVQQTWDRLGVTTELSANDANAWSEQLFETFDWDTGFVQVAPVGPVQLSSFFAGATPDKGGNNFMFVDNAAYKSLIKKATAASPEETCELWQQAEAELIKRTDVFPLADNELRTYLSGVQLELPNFVTPTTIRMLG